MSSTSVGNLGRQLWSATPVGNLGGRGGGCNLKLLVTSFLPIIHSHWEKDFTVMFIFDMEWWNLEILFNIFDKMKKYKSPSDKLQNSSFLTLHKTQIKMKVWWARKLCILLFMLVGLAHFEKNKIYFFWRNMFYDISLALMYQMTTSFWQE